MSGEGTMRGCALMVIVARHGRRMQGMMTRITNEWVGG